MQAVYASANESNWNVILYDQWITDVDKSSDVYTYIGEARALPRFPPAGPPEPKNVALIEITVYSNKSVSECTRQVKATYETLENIYKE